MIDIIAGEKTTKAFRPFELIFSESLDVDSIDARKKEKYWKSGVEKKATTD